MFARFAALSGWSFVGATVLLFGVVAAIIHGLAQFLDARTRLTEDTRDARRTGHVTR
jgi:hypothetical protein